MGKICAAVVAAVGDCGWVLFRGLKTAEALSPKTAADAASGGRTPETLVDDDDARVGNALRNRRCCCHGQQQQGDRREHRAPSIRNPLPHYLPAYQTHQRDASRDNPLCRESSIRIKGGPQAFHFTARKRKVCPE